MVVDALLARSPGARGQEAGDAWTAEAQVAGVPVVLAKPLTFMNRSGPAVARLAAERGAAAADVVVILDDVALELGTIRVRERGSHGGHNGLRSIVDTLGTEDVPRVRVGISRSEVEGDLADFVLSEFPPEDVLVVQEAVGAAADAVECLVREGPAAAMNRFNGRPRT
jgi:PTH1 family peptidyl-tRNA hydrolase